MFLRRRRGLRVLPVRVLRASGPRHTGSRNGILHLPGRTDAALALILALRELPGWDAIVVGWLDARWAQADALRRELPCQSLHHDRSVAMIRIEGDYESYLASRSPKFRGNVRRAEAALSRAGSYAIDVYRGAEVDEAVFGRMVGVERASWKGDSRVGIAAPSRLDFYARFIRAASAKGWSRLYLLRDGDRDVAFNYLLDTGSRTTGYRMSYREDYRKIAPGGVLLRRAIEDSFRAGLAEFDFFDPPKTHAPAHWANDRLPLVQVVTYNRWGAGGAVWLGRRIRQRFARAG
jgi:hypothetical protein